MWLQERLRLRLFADDRGFTTVGMALALLIALALIFSAAQVYQVNSASAEIQEVADAAALAAENQVAQFYILAQLCDAILLSQTLTALILFGVGLVFLCVPLTQGLGTDLLSLGHKLLDARKSFLGASSESLNALQKTLPFLAAGSAVAVVQANGNQGFSTSYVGLAALLPLEGTDISLPGLDGADAFAQEVDSSRDQIAEGAKEAEELAAAANEEKLKAFMADCGNNPAYCMYERSAHLAGLSGSANPLYHSVDTWSFSVALDRAKRYYQARLAQEAPENDSAEERARSALRKNFYSFCCERMKEGYVHEGDVGQFDAEFPLMPKNTEEMKKTELYTQAIYPVSVESGHEVMHAYEECPGITSGISARGSLAARDGGNMPTCPQCQLESSSMGKVAAASTSIDNGFEYHYNVVAKAAEAYEEKQRDFSQEASQVENQVTGLFDQLLALAKEALSQRIEVQPPGRYGAVALVASAGSSPASGNFPSSFVSAQGSLGSRVALSGATLAQQPEGENGNVITALLDGLKDKVPWLSSVQGSVLLDLWSSVLSAYGSGQRALIDGVRSICSSGKLVSVSGLGPHMASALEDCLSQLGLQPASLSSWKPVTVSSGHVLSADGSAFASRLYGARQFALDTGEGSLLSSAASALVVAGFQKLEGSGGEHVIASVDFTGSSGGEQPVVVVLPEWVDSLSTSFLNSLADRVGSVVPGFSAGRQWE